MLPTLLAGGTGKLFYITNVTRKTGLWPWISCWPRFPAISGEGRRDWLIAALGQSAMCKSLMSSPGCDWAETSSARPSDGFGEAAWPGKVFLSFLAFPNRQKWPKV